MVQVTEASWAVYVPFVMMSLVSFALVIIVAAAPAVVVAAAVVVRGA